MALREITPEERWQNRLTRDAREPAPMAKLGKFAFPELPVLKGKEAHIKFGKTGAAILLVLTGLYFPGTYTGPVMQRMTGIMATLFYQWQLGILFVVVGAILFYDTWRR